MSFSNKYKGTCGCGTQVPAGEGYYRNGTVRCVPCTTLPMYEEAFGVYRSPESE